MDVQSDNLLLYRDLYNLMLGERLGWGVARTVYVFTQKPSQVVKVEKPGNYQNVMEWETWKAVRDTKARRWFAPCHALSDDGRILIMERTTPQSQDRYPVRMPAFLCDFKYGNYGLLDGKIVCHDYGRSLLMKHGMTERLRKVTWWTVKPWNERDD
jgi:hypothetical protein